MILFNKNSLLHILIYVNNTPSAFLRFDLFDRIGIRNLLSVTNLFHY